MQATIGIRELSGRLNRVQHTVRQWENKGWLPEHLLPSRDDRGRRYWTEDQFQQIKEWIEEVDLRPGKGLPHYKTKNKS